MENTFWLISLPAFVALCFKAGIFAYAQAATRYNLQTRLYLLALFALAIQNVAEIAHFSAISKHEVPVMEVTVFYATSIAAFPLFFHLALTFAGEVLSTPMVRRLYALGYVLSGALVFLLIFTPWLIKGYEAMNYTVTRVPGPLYFLFETYVVLLSAAIVAVLVAGAAAERNVARRTRTITVLFAVVPMLLVAVFVVVALHIGVRRFNAALAMPVATTYFLLVTAYAVHQHRLFDIQFFIPWSKVRKRKTAFYERVRAMIAEMADLGTGSVSRALDRLADTLRCPVAFVDDSKSVIAAVGAPQMLAVPLDALKTVDQILVANEIADAKPEMYAAMKQHGIAAIVPFHPHSHSAASWLLLGEAFSDQVYTARDFRMVEQLFDKMADLFLDKLVEMRTKLADAHLQIQGLTFKLELAQANNSVLEEKVGRLGRDNLRLVQEQSADSLLLIRRPPLGQMSITFLGWNKDLRQRLRARFPHLEHFAGVESASFRRRPMPDVLLCEVEKDSRGVKLAEFVARGDQRCAVLLLGDGAAAFAKEYRKQLLGKTVEVLPNGLSDEAVERRVGALVRLRQSLVAVPYADAPLLGSSRAYCDMLSEVYRISGFTDPVCLVSADADEAVAVGAYLHETSKSGGAFRVLRTSKLGAHEAHTDSEYGDHDIEALLADLKGGTLMIDDLGALPNGVWERLLYQSNDFENIRLVAACSPSVAQTPEAMFRPLRPVVAELPTLRERREDLPLLVHYFTLQFNLQAGTQRYMSQGALDDLMAAAYPENLASLKAAVFEQLREGSQRDADVTVPAITDVGADKSLDESVAEFEKRLITETLRRCDGNKSKAARILGVRPNTLHYKLERYGLLKGKD